MKAATMWERTRNTNLWSDKTEVNVSHSLPHFGYRKDGDLWEKVAEQMLRNTALHYFCYEALVAGVDDFVVQWKMYKELH